MHFQNNDMFAREIQAAIRDYIKVNITEPLGRDRTIKNSLSQDLQNKTREIKEANRNILDMSSSMQKLSKQGIKELTSSLFDLSKGAKTAKQALKKELALLTQELLETILSNIKVTQIPNFGKTDTGKKDNILGGIFDFATSLLGFRAGGGQVGAGQAFIVGEKGPELLLTGRTAGQIIPNSQLGNNNNSTKLDVKIINNNNSNVSIREKQNSNGMQELEILIDNMVAKSLTNSGSKAFQALENTYGITPTLNGR